MKVGLVTKSPTPTATLISQSFPPETHAGANRAIALANALSERYDLTVIAPMPSHPTPDRYTDFKTGEHDNAMPFTVLRCHEFSPHTSGYIRRGLREAVMAWSMARNVDPGTDIVVATTPSFFVAPAAKFASWHHGARFHWDIRDLTWEYVSEVVKELPHRRNLRRAGSTLMRSVAGVVARHSDTVIASNSGIADYFRSEFNCRNVHLARNGVSSDMFASLRDAASSAQEAKRFRVVYVGALGYFQALDTMLDAAAVLPDIDFRIVGDGPERNRLTRAVHDRGLDNVTLTGFVDRSEVYEEYANAQILFAQLREMDVTRSATVPSKIYEYLAAGKPIIYAGQGITASFLDGTGGALVIAPQEHTDLVRAINYLGERPELRSSMGESGRQSVRARMREDIMREAVNRIVNPGYDEELSPVIMSDTYTETAPRTAH